jgi:hypothetical protein
MFASEPVSEVVARPDPEIRHVRSGRCIRVIRPRLPTFLFTANRKRERTERPNVGWLYNAHPTSWTTPLDTGDYVVGISYALTM